MRPVHAEAFFAPGLPKSTDAEHPRDAAAARPARADARDFFLVSLFVLAFLMAGYLALWKPLLYRLS